VGCAVPLEVGTKRERKKQRKGEERKRKEKMSEARSKAKGGSKFRERKKKEKRKRKRKRKNKRKEREVISCSRGAELSGTQGSMSLNTINQVVQMEQSSEVRLLVLVDTV
jgi:hypothetical protein